MKKILISLIILTFFYNCKRSVFEAPENSQSNSVAPVETQLNITETDETKLFPENGQTGGLGNAGINNIVRAFFYSPKDGRWRVLVILRNINNNIITPINNAEITVNIRYSGNKFKTYKLNNNGKGQYSLYNSDISPKIERKTGYFHILKKDSSDNLIDFKLGFGIELSNVYSICVNGVMRYIPTYYAIKIQKGSNITITATSSINAKYYEISLRGPGGEFEILNYYSPSGLINIPGAVTLAYSGVCNLFVIATHSYLAKGFITPRYSDNTPQVSGVFTRYGEKFGLGCFVEFN